MYITLQDVGYFLCDARSISPGKYFIFYLLAFFVAGAYDRRIFSDYWRAQFNPFSFKKYGVIAVVNLAFFAIFFLMFLSSPICKSSIH